MSDFSKFRSSVGGFNRSDVVNYIESVSVAHQKELRNLQDENEKLRGENEKLAQLLAEVQAKLMATPSEETQPIEVAEPREQTSEEDYSSKELDAYRRAEAAERNAVIRANKIYAQISELCARTRSQLSGTGEEIGALTTDLNANLVRLQEAFADLQVIFEDTENSFDELELPAQTE